jgi:RNA polymerase sigma-70 factor (ECF subfamily)
MTLGADDHDLIKRIAASDRRALAILISRHQARVFRFVTHRVRNAAIAEEIVNEVFLETWRGAAKFEGRSNVSSWLLSIAHNRAISSTRRKREESWDEDHAAELADEGDDPEVALQKTDKGALVRQCMAKLSSDHREIIDLVYYHEQSVAEVSLVLGIPEATVKTRMFYARKKLGELLKEAGIDRGWP